MGLQLAVFARGHVGVVRGSSTRRMSGVPYDYSATTRIRGYTFDAQAGVKHFPVPSVSFDLGSTGRGSGSPRPRRRRRCRSWA